MSKEKREEQVKVINSLLELKRKVVGVKFYYDEEEYEACPAQQVKYYIPYCVTVRWVLNMELAGILTGNNRLWHIQMYGLH